MRKGAEIDYVIRWQGLPMKWRTLITEYNPPMRFVDEQARGPYALWHHEHTFEETAEGVEIRGPLGAIAHAVMVKRQLLEIFRFRQGAIAKILDVPRIRFDDPRVVRLA